MNAIADLTAAHPLIVLVSLVFAYKLCRALIDFLSTLLRPCAQCLIANDEEWACQDDFAAAAMLGLLEGGHQDAEEIATRAYRMAGAMMKARAK